jgi:hypothetical protein
LISSLHYLSIELAIDYPTSPTSTTTTKKLDNRNTFSRFILVPSLPYLSFELVILVAAFPLVAVWVPASKAKVRIQKPSYNNLLFNKFSVTSCARLPKLFKFYLL